MKLLQIVAVALLGALPTSASPTPSTPQHDTRAIALMDALTKNANDAFRERELQRKRSSPDEAQCTLATARVRKDWSVALIWILVRVGQGPIALTQLQGQNDRR